MDSGLNLFQRKTTFCNKFKPLALLTICANVSNSEGQPSRNGAGSTSHFKICPIFANLGLEFNNFKADIRVNDTFLIWKLSNLPMEFALE